MIHLSPTRLNLFKECPRCFWLENNQSIKRPQMVFPTILNGMDSAVKAHVDNYRGSLPPELLGRVSGVLLHDRNTISRWRNWKTGLEYVDANLDAKLIGALDDCLVDSDFYVPIDFKTRGYPPKKGDAEKYYQLQLDVYELLLNENGYPTKGIGYVVYYYPSNVQAGGVVTFDIEVHKMKTNKSNARTTFEAAVNVLKGRLPQSGTECSLCAWHDDLKTRGL